MNKALRSIEDDNENWRGELWPVANEFFELSPSATVASTVPHLDPSFRLSYSAVDVDEMPEPSSFFSKMHNHRHANLPVLANYELRNNKGAKTLSSLPPPLPRLKLVVQTPTNLSRLDTLCWSYQAPVSRTRRLTTWPCGRAIPTSSSRGFASASASMPTCPSTSNSRPLSRSASALRSRRTRLLCRLNPSEPKKLHVPSLCTAREAFLWYVDIDSPLRKSFLGFLSQYATDEAEKAALAHMALPAGKVCPRISIPMMMMLMMIMVAGRVPSVHWRRENDSTGDAGEVSFGAAAA